ncbi:unnamed protein product [Periconia digitata]|uniref:AA1-like domain-containing protein n=1 Tax=Periconia digitata TaxID=1303443 RepID=A0A9W4UJ13_9PLEO|nr:unnamed protein product [Periconia digitata]
MHFTKFAFATLTGLSSASVVRRADYGSWAVTWNDNSLTAVYSTTELDGPITTTCTSEPDSTPVCDTRFRYDFLSNEEGQNTISLMQEVPLWDGHVTVYGDAVILEEGSATVIVDRATSSNPGGSK